MSARRHGLILVPAARRDYRSILLYSSQEWGERQQMIYEAARNHPLAMIAENPGIGRLREGMPPNCRTFPVEQHVIVYRVDGGTITILRILHHRRDIARALRGRR